VFIRLSTRGLSFGQLKSQIVDIVCDLYSALNVVELGLIPKSDK